MYEHKLTKTQYNTVHQWMKRHYSKSGSCDHCGTVGKTEWSNKTGQYLKENRMDWQELCKKCHYKYDREILFRAHPGGNPKGRPTWLSANHGEASRIGKLGSDMRKAKLGY